MYRTPVVDVKVRFLDETRESNASKLISWFTRDMTVMLLVVIFSSLQQLRDDDELGASPGPKTRASAFRWERAMHE